MTPARSGGDTADLVLTGGGGAARCVLLALAGADLAGRLPRPLRVVVVDPVPAGDHPARHRTWCSWGVADPLLSPVVHASWRHVRVRDGARDLVLDLDPLRYRLVRSDDLEEHVAEQVARAPGLLVDHVATTATSVADDGPGRARVDLADGDHIRASLVLDSRPARPVRPGSVFWWQHFRGWTLPAGAVADRPAGADGAVDLMDFRTPQPARGLSFGYVLPLPDGRSLAEYTEFSPERLDDAGYDRALRDYLGLLGVDPAVVPDHVETGAIPMTDARFARRAGDRVLRIGTAGGATRGSTGYTFAAMLRDARAVAGLVGAGGLGRPGRLHLPAPYPRRHRWIDAVQLRALDAGLVAGPRFFVDLFERRPAGQVLRFLDGLTSPAEEVAVMSGAPTLPMTRAAAQDARARVARTVRRRRPPSPPPVPAPPVPAPPVLRS
ncbi:lycopene cyclase family protein [Aquipuribacter nitratireducens]|uniref:Lycopene cyclase family protein n=1 Tax=Aquipuribacter nitratireducens TaxID=650104 RepID=A0ABW0GN08_9MICO